MHGATEARPVIGRGWCPLVGFKTFHLNCETLWSSYLYHNCHNRVILVLVEMNRKIYFIRHSLITNVSPIRASSVWIMISSSIAYNIYSYIIYIHTLYIFIFIGYRIQYLRIDLHLTKITWTFPYSDVDSAHVLATSHIFNSRSIYNYQQSVHAYCDFQKQPKIIIFFNNKINSGLKLLWMR